MGMCMCMHTIKLLLHAGIVIRDLVSTLSTAREGGREGEYSSYELEDNQGRP